MTLLKKKKPAAASSVVSGEALGMDANIAMLVKERNANNAWHKLARNKNSPRWLPHRGFYGSHRRICPAHRAI